jgi:hypothetical protein
MRWIVSLRWSLIYILRATSRHPCEIPRASPLYYMSVGSSPPRSPKQNAFSDLEYIVISSELRDIFSRNGNVAK